MEPKVIMAPYLDYNTIRARADDFLVQYKNDDDYFTDIESIVEFDMSLGITPIPLRDAYQIEAFISNDLSEIFVDDYVFTNHEYRYRFSLAHEVGHLRLHKDLFDNINFSSTEDWKNLIQDFPVDQYSYFENQAYQFAGLILVPDKTLNICYDESLKELDKHGVTKNDFEVTMFYNYVSRHMADKYRVSKGVILRRLKYNRIISEEECHKIGI